MDPNPSATPGLMQRYFQPFADRMQAWSAQLPATLSHPTPARSLYEPNTIGGDRTPFAAWRTFEQKRLQTASTQCATKEFSLASYNKSFTDIVCTAPG